MFGRLRRQTDGSRVNHDTSHDSDEILAFFGAMHLARRLKSAYAMWKNERADNLLAFAEGCKRPVFFNLAITRSGRPLPSGSDDLTTKHAIPFDILQRWTESLNMGFTRMTSAQREFRLALRFLQVLRPRNQSDASSLELDRHSARRLMCCPALVPSRETMHWTSRVCDRR
jgi:hypothetical protein